MKVATIYVLRDVNGKPTEIAAGTIKVIGGVIAATPTTDIFTLLMQRLSKAPINVKGEMVSPESDPAAFVEGLPFAYRGSHMWAVVK